MIPLIKPSEFESFKESGMMPSLLELEEWDPQVFSAIQTRYPKTLILLRTSFESDLLSYYQAGVRVFHLIADYHGRGKTGQFVLDLIRKAHLTFLEAKCRDEVTLIGSGGIVAAEHLAKGIICGLDAVALDTSVLVALQAKFINSCIHSEKSQFYLPTQLTIKWGTQRLKNLAGTWQDQLLEILGAMGMREVRRMRGCIGRAMFQQDLEKEAFAGIKGYGSER